MPSPRVLPAPGTPLFRQLQAYLATDTDPANGLLAALGNGASSIYPNFTTDGPATDRTVCPTPFLIVAPGGVRATDPSGRDERVVIEVHDDADQGDLRWPGIVARLVQWVCVNEWRPASDGAARYLTGLQFDTESPSGLSDTRYDTLLVQLIFVCRRQDRTSNRGRQG